jgi:hypothetical protein
MGLQAIELTLAELVPKLGQPTAVQRKPEFPLAPGLGLEWTIQCYLDLETLRPDEHGELHPAIVDYKIKGSPLSQQKADHDPQAGLYLAARWLEGAPARDFSFAQIAKPGPRRRQMSASLITTQRSAGQLRATLARIALAAAQIAALNERSLGAPFVSGCPGVWRFGATVCGGQVSEVGCCWSVDPGRGWGDAAVVAKAEPVGRRPVCLVRMLRSEVEVLSWSPDRGNPTPKRQGRGPELTGRSQCGCCAAGLP